MARSELIFGLVGPMGTRLNALSECLGESLERFGYSVTDIGVSGLLANFTEVGDIPSYDEHARIRFLQKRGNAFRHRLQRADALALASIAAIRAERAGFTGNPNIAAPDRAFVLNQLKHPAEVDLLRQVYGPNFILLAGYANAKKRETDLIATLARKSNQPGDSPQLLPLAAELIMVDAKEDDDRGQNTRDTYPLADFFSNLSTGRGQDVHRFIDLFFGHPFHTPAPEEYAMYQASAVALRSSDWGRQVGAVIVALGRDADLIAVGANEVPRARGGYYILTDSPDHRDQALLYYHGEDRASELKAAVLRELIERMRAKDWFIPEINEQSSAHLADELLKNLKRTQFMDIGEFGRPVHAEMAALIDAARRGVAVNGHSMYVTAFPCHNCAKHIIAAGISRVIYLEPYPKSRAPLLHGEEVDLESPDGRENPEKVVFSAFTGIAPRQYRQLFSMAERGKDKGHSLRDWQEARKKLISPYVPPTSVHAYIAAEREALKHLPADVYRWSEQKWGECT